MTEKSENYREMKKIFKSIADYDLHERKGGRFVFHFYFTRSIRETDISALELSVRAYNGLKRAGYHTVGDLAEAICSGTDIRKIRNCGLKSYSEIMEKLFLYNLANIPEAKREKYIIDMVQKNRS